MYPILLQIIKPTNLTSERNEIMAKEPLCREEMLLPYSKYYNYTLFPREPMQLELLEIPLNPEDALPPESLNELLKPGYLARECGCCVLPDGTGYAAAYTYMPDVTVEMIDWWYIWHFFRPASVPATAGNLRYKLWCPIEHWDTGFNDDYSRSRALDNSIPLRERRYGSSNFIYESIDGGVGNKIMIQARCFDPVEFGFDPALLGRDGGTVVASSCINTSIDGLNIYHFRPAFCGVEMRIRNYKGIRCENGTFVRTVDAENSPITVEQMKRSAYHALLEYPHLARFLPALYAEQSRKPIDED